MLALAVLGLALAALAVFHVRTTYGWWFVRGPEYGATFAEVSGLAEGAEVRYAGLGVGRVRRVEIGPADARRVLCGKDHFARSGGLPRPDPGCFGGW